MIRKTFLTLTLLFALALAACTSTGQPTSAPSSDTAPAMSADDTTDDPMAEDMSGDEEMEENMDEAEEAMDDDMSDDEDMMEVEDMMEDDMADAEDMMEDMTPITFTVRIENVGSADGLTILAPGAFEVNNHPLAFFTPGEADRGQGLEALAEDGNPGILVESISNMMDEDMGGFEINVFNTPVGAEEPGPVTPGSAYEFTFSAYDGQYLTFATMFVQSNDWFFSPGPDGIALFDKEGVPLSGDITHLILLWNAGTEVDQTPGEGTDQAPRQAGPDTGEVENGVVSEVDWDDFGIVVTISPQP